MNLSNIERTKDAINKISKTMDGMKDELTFRKEIMKK